MQVTCPAMWVQIPALFAEKVVAPSSKNRFRAKKHIGNHPRRVRGVASQGAGFSPCTGLDVYTLHGLTLFDQVHRLAIFVLSLSLCFVSAKR
jgi:hypothetical protein